jgi:hypothetical protein
MRLFAVLPRLVSATLAVSMLLSTPAWLHADDQEDAEKAAHALAYDQEKEEFNIRAETWVRMLEPKVGKANRMQLFKGNEYCFCVAVPKKSGVHITGAVLDLEGKPAGDLRQTLTDVVTGLLIAAPVYLLFSKLLSINLPGLTQTGWL